MVLSSEDANWLLKAIPTERLIGKQDHALVATMLYRFARVSAVLNLRLRDVIRYGVTRLLEVVVPIIW